MIRHHFKIAFRSLLKYKVQMGISIMGLSVGFVCLSLSLLWVRYEMTYDTFHKGADRIYLGGTNIHELEDGFSYYSTNELFNYLLKECPEIETVCRIHPTRNENQKVKYRGIEFPMPQIEVDSNFVTMFDITVLSGNTPLHLNKDQIAITDKAAKRIFGKESPIGKQLVFTQNGNEEKTIVAVVKSWEGHSLFPFDILLPYCEEEYARLYTLFRVYPNSNIKALEERLKDPRAKRKGGRLSLSTPIAKLTELRNLHPKDDVEVNLNHIRIFASVGALVIICGLCNYLSVLITRIRMRKRELALRKVNGASDKSLMTLILTELFLLLSLSFGVGGILIELILPAFKQLSQINENTSFFYGEILIYMLLLIVITTVTIAVLIHYINKRTLSDSISRKSDIHFSGWFYKGNILFQIFISTVFVFCTLTMMKQLNFLMNTRELGLDRNNVGAIVNSDAFKNVPWSKILNQIPDVTQHLDGFLTPIPKVTSGFCYIQDWDEKSIDEQPIEVEEERITQEYVDFFGIELLEGSIPDEEKDGRGCVAINEAAAKVLGWKEPIGKKMNYCGNNVRVKGIIKDIYHKSPIHPVTPTVFTPPISAIYSNYIFRVKEGTWDKVTQILIQEVKKVNPDIELEIINLDDVYSNFMKSEYNLIKLLSVVSFICILIAVFGIFSLVTLSCQQRRKEIAIRKVNGANVRVILNLFFKEYLFLLIMASCLAFPLSYVIMRHWLETYMKQTSVAWWLYVGVFIMMALIIFLSIIWRVWKAARQNPAEIIKNE